MYGSWECGNYFKGFICEWFPKLEGTESKVLSGFEAFSLAHDSLMKILI